MSEESPGAGLGADSRRTGLTEVPFREWVHRPGPREIRVTEEKARFAVARLLPLCVVSSSDPGNVYEFAVERRSGKAPRKDNWGRTDKRREPRYGR